MPPKFFMPKRSKNYHSDLALETGGFSPRGITILSMLKPHHNTLYCTPITDQYDSCIVYEVIRTTSSLFIYFFFFTKRFRAYKNANQAKTNRQNKTKRKKDNKGDNFSCTKTSKGGKLYILRFSKKLKLS